MMKRGSTVRMNSRQPKTRRKSLLKPSQTTTPSLQMQRTWCRRFRMTLLRSQKASRCLTRPLRKLRIKDRTKTRHTRRSWETTKHQHHRGRARVDPPATASAAVQEAFSFVQTSAGQGRVAPDAAPDTWAKDKSAKGPSASILNMLNTLIKDTKKQVAEMKAEETDAQFEYEQFMKDSSEKHMSDSKALSVKESEKAEAEAGLQKRTKALKSTTAEATANAEYLASLH